MPKFVRDDSIALGDDVKDDITGLKGTVIAITEWLNGCRRVCVQPKNLHEGKPVEAITLDAEQVSLVKAHKPVATKPTGGPSISPARHASPTR